MTPDDAGRKLRDDAEHLMQLLSKMRRATPSDFTREDLYAWCCQMLEQNAQFKGSMASFLEELSGVIMFEMISNDKIRLQQALPQGHTLSNPPFDANYFLGLNDI